MATISPYRNLPKVVQIIEVEDHGEFGAAACPHCGAQGRYIVRFVCEGGEIRGAMRGCFGHFPKHPFVQKDLALRDKARGYAQKGWTLPSWDVAVKEAINDYALGNISEAEAAGRIATAEARRDGYLRRRFGRR